MPSLNELGRKVKAKYPDQYGAMSDIEVGRRVKAKYADSYQNFHGAEVPGLAKAGLGLLPSIGGGVGGAIGGTAGAAAGGVGALPGALGGAALGGAGGEAIRQLAGHALGATGFNTEDLNVPQESYGAYRDIMRQVPEQAGAELLGLGASKVVAKAGRPLMELAIKATPEVAQTAINEGITATSKGLQRLMRRIGDAGSQTKNIVLDASKRGLRFDGIRLAQNVFQKVYPDIAGQPLARAEKRRLLKMVYEFAGTNPRSVSPVRLHVWKQKSDQLAKQIYARIENGMPVTANEALDQKFHKALADEARMWLDTTVPNYESSNARTESLIKVKDAIWPASKKETSIPAQLARAAARPATGAAVGAAVGAATPGNRGHNAAIGAGIGALAGTPQALSSAAVGLQNPILAQLLRQLPRSAWAGLQGSQ